MNHLSTSTGQLIDRFGRLKAEAAEITGELDAIKSILIEREGDHFKGEGEMFRLSLVNTITSRVDWKSVALVLARKAQISDKAFDALVAGATDCGTQWVARSSARITK